MDRTKDFISAAERFLDTASLPPEQVRRLREAVLLGRRSRTTAPEGSFAAAAKGIEDSIRTLWDSIRSMQLEYTREADALASPDPAKDANEAQVAAVIGRIGSYVDRLKQAATQAQAGSGAHVNEHTAAHMHGVVLILAERLHRATICFDRLRAARYQALIDQRAPGAPSAAASGTTVAGRAGGRPLSSLSGGTGLAAEAAAGGTESSGASGAAATGKPVSGRRVNGANGRTGWQHILGVQVAGIKGHDEEDAGHARTHAAGAGGGGEGGSGKPEWPVQMQALEQENKALLERLTATRNAALSVEQAVRDVAALNQMFSAAVLAQAETIESIYLAAVEATHNIKAGNESLTKTVAVNRSTSRYIIVLLLAATLSLLFYDWFNS